MSSAISFGIEIDRVVSMLVLETDMTVQLKTTGNTETIDCVAAVVQTSDRKVHVVERDIAEELSLLLPDDVIVIAEFDNQVSSLGR